MTNYPWRVRAGSILSQAINAIIFGGHPDMSLSTRAYLEGDASRFWSFARTVANFLFGADHCAESFQSDVSYAQDILRFVMDQQEQAR